VAIPNLDTFEQLELGISLWRLQTVTPYLIVVDTGSSPDVCRKLEQLRAPDCEVHFIQGVDPHNALYRHPYVPISVALDLAHGLCRTEYVFQTHTDVFPRRRDFLEWMITQTTPQSPVVGWRMSERTTGPWRECVSHTATMIHNPTWRLHGLTWNLQGYLDSHPDEAELRQGWPDVESGLWHSMKRASLTPLLIGDDLNHERLTTEWFDHSRSFTAIKRWVQAGNITPHWQRAERDMVTAESEARARLIEWQGQYHQGALHGHTSTVGRVG
jgi:hypothetical protein